MTKLLSFTEDLKLPIDFLMEPIALLGNRGGGKTYSGMKLFEAAHDAGVQCIAVDIVGKWWALRLGADGKPAGGLSDVFIFGGKHADFPITPDQGAFVAKVVAERRIHVVLDLSLMRKHDRQRFLIAFAEEYFLLKKQEDSPTPCVLFIEEAHAVLPQKPFGPDQMRMLGAFRDLVAEGRNAGIGVVVMDQRPATCNKDALALVEVLVVLRTTYKSDRDVYVDWIVQKEGGADADRVELVKTLPFLKTGQAYLYAPQFDIFSKIQISPKRTFDSSATVKIGGKSAVVGNLTPVDVEQLKGDMAAVLEKAKADDPRVLRAQVAELQKELAKKHPPAAPPQKPERIEVPVLTDKQVARLGKAAQAVLAGQEQLAAAMKDIAPGMARIHAAAANPARVPPVGYRDEAGPIRTVYVGGVAPVRFNPAPQPVPPGIAGEIKLKAGARLMAGVLAAYPNGLTRKDLGAMSGINPTSGTFSEYINALIRMGIVAAVADHKVTSNAEPIATAWDDVLRRWHGDFKAGARTMLALLREKGPMTRAELGGLAGINPTSGTFSEYINALKRAGLVDDVDHRVFVSPTLAAL